MDRRHFLTRLVSGVVGISLVDAQWIPTAITSHVPLTADLESIDWMASEFIKQIALAMPDFRGRFVPGVYAVGDGEMTAQYAIDWAHRPTLSPDRVIRECIVPAASQLSDVIQRKGMRAFGALPIPHIDCEGAVAMDETLGVSIRAIRQWMPYEPMTDTPGHWINRVDVLGKAA